MKLNMHIVMQAQIVFDTISHIPVLHILKSAIEVQPTVQTTVEPTVHTTVEQTVETAVKPTVQTTVQHVVEVKVEPALEQVEVKVEPALEQVVEVKVEPELESQIEVKVEPEIELAPEHVGVVVTTYGKNNVFAIQNIRCVRKYLPNAKIFLYMNEVIHKVDILKACKELSVETIIVHNQDEYGGLTATWNDGISKCMSHHCDIIILSNDDLFINETIQHIIHKTKLSMHHKEMSYFGPVTNNPGPLNEQQLFVTNMNPLPIISHRGLNGFFMVFPAYVLNESKFDDTHFFDPAFPFGGNEDEWYKRFSEKGGKPVIVPSTFVYHYKLQLWRKNVPTKNNICIYTVNTGNYDDQIVQIDTKYDYLYFTDSLDFVYQCVNLGITPFYLEKVKHPKIQQRTIKIMPHLYLPDIYDIAVYMDANVIPNMNVVDMMINTIHNNKIDLIHVMHPDRISIKEEAEIVIRKKLEHNANVKRIIDMQQQDQFRDDAGLTETALLVRKYKNIIGFSEEWLKCVKICVRDQISFNYLLWKYNVPSIRMDNINKNVYNKNKHPLPTLESKRNIDV